MRKSSCVSFVHLLPFPSILSRSKFQEQFEFAFSLDNRLVLLAVVSPSLLAKTFPRPTHVLQTPLFTCSTTNFQELLLW